VDRLACLFVDYAEHGLKLLADCFVRLPPGQRLGHGIHGCDAATLRLAAKQALQHPAVHFTGQQALAIGRGFEDYVRRSELTVWACSILPAHVHLVIARPRLLIEQVVLQLKCSAIRQLLDEQLHPFAHLAAADGTVPTCWAERLWKVFLNTEASILEEIQYVENNPVKEGKRRQRWPFVFPYPQRNNINFKK
jgi:REP element-mobilizing transposase RayT